MKEEKTSDAETERTPSRQAASSSASSPHLHSSAQHCQAKNVNDRRHAIAATTAAINDGTSFTIGSHLSILLPSPPKRQREKREKTKAHKEKETPNINSVTTNVIYTAITNNANSINNTASKQKKKNKRREN